ncbi:MAG: leucine-rich repeat protein [Pseudoflavonifractor sp.]|nr:leucine-rich repeat protein [Pseudoflavonifractor sp.]
MTRLTFAILLLAISMPAMAASYTFSYYDKEKKACRIGEYIGEDIEVIEIPNNHVKDGVTYKVTSVDSNAFKNLKNLRVVKIGANLMRIGNSDSKTALDINGGINNFNGCTALTKFEVNSSNTAFASTSNGVLTSKDGSQIFRVPQRVVTDNGQFTIPGSGYRYVRPGAFTGNTTISVVIIGNKVRLYPNPGLSRMSILEKFEVTDNDNYFVSSGALFDTYAGDSQSARLVCLPRKAGTTYKIPTTVTQVSSSGTKTKRNVTAIADGAFAYNTALTSVTMPATVTSIGQQAFAGTKMTAITIPTAVTSIGDEAFANSGLTKITIPESANNYDDAVRGKGMLYGSKSLTEIVLKGSRKVIPDNFAAECSSLKKVTVTPANGMSVRQSAFKNCTSLTDFPLLSSVEYEGDSIFANTGFSKIVFEKASYNADLAPWGTGMFTGCQNLTSIDMSALTAETTIPRGFATLCPKLKTVIFPQDPTIKQYSFGNNNNLSKIVMFQCTTDIPLFGYTEDASPKLYLATKKSYPDCMLSISNIFNPSSGAKVTPRIYCDAFSLDESVYMDYPTGVKISGAKWYIPAHTGDNYSRLGTVSEMFTLDITPSGDKTRIEYRPVISGLTFTSINLGDGSIALNPDGAVKTVDTKFSKIKSVYIGYTVNDVEMVTAYPGDFFKNLNQQTAIDSPMDDALSYSLDGRTLTIFSPTGDARYSLIDMRGATVLTGDAPTADLSAIQSGVYLLRITDGNDSLSAKVMIH